MCVVHVGYIGIIIAIKSEDEKTKARISKDFVETCKNILDESRVNQPFQLIELNDYFAKLATDNVSANQLRIRCKGHLLIFGDTVQRQEKRKEFYVLRLRGLVSHIPANPNTQSILAYEMDAVLPLKKSILKENELSGFEVTSIQLAEATKYVIATAALISHDFELAIDLLEELQQTKARLKSKSKDKAIQQLIEYIPNRLADAYRFASTVHFLRWEISRDAGELQQAISCEEKYTKLKPNDDLRFILINAMAHFVLARKKHWCCNEVY